MRIDRWPGVTMHELPSADPSLLPAMREQAGALGQQFVDVFVGFRLRFRDEAEASAVARHFRFASTRSALRDEGGGLVWVGFHGWAFDARDAQMQAALAVRHSAVQARVRHIPAATDAELRPTGRRLTDMDKARRERDELLARLDDATPAMRDTSRLALGSGAPPRGRPPGGYGPPPGPRLSTPPPSARPAARGPAAPGPGAAPAKKKRRLFGR
jgi:hypothetical protein